MKNKLLWIALVLIVITISLFAISAYTEQNDRVTYLEEKERQELYNDRQLRLNDLELMLNSAILKRQEAVSNLNNASGFKLLRTESERDKEIRHAEKWVSDWENKIVEIKTEIKTLRDIQDQF